MRDLGIAIVGSGFIAPVHVEALRRIGRRVVGILGSSPEKSAAAAQVLRLERAYNTYEDLLADPAVNVVHLASPNRLHMEGCRKALAAGKHVICEKPLGMSSEETQLLVELADRAQLVSAVNYNVRFYPLCLEVRERIRAGDLGTLYHITGSYVQDWLLHETDFNWRVLTEEGGQLRAIADIGSHWLDLVTFITGLQVEEVCADLRTFLPTRKRPRGGVQTFKSKETPAEATEQVPIRTEDYGSILLRFTEGASGTLTVSQVTAGRKNCLRYEIAGSKSAVAWNSERPDELWLGHRDRANELLIRDPALLHTDARLYTSYPGGHNEGFSDTFKQLYRAIYDYIEAGDFDAPRPFPTFRDGHRMALIGEAIWQSHRERQWVAVVSDV